MGAGASAGASPTDPRAGGRAGGGQAGGRLGGRAGGRRAGGVSGCGRSGNGWLVGQLVGWPGSVGHVVGQSVGCERSQMNQAVAMASAVAVSVCFASTLQLCS